MDYTARSGLDPEDLEVFLAEVRELLDSIEENLVAFERSPAHDALIDELFRAMHTIKGNAATLGLEDGAKVTHMMESVLDGIRSGARRVTPEIVNTLFIALDWLKEWKSALASGGHGPPLPPLSDMQAAVSGYVAYQIQNAGQAEDSPPGSLSQVLSRALGDGSNVYVMTVKFKSDAPLLSARCFQALALIGEVVDVLGSVPSVDEIESDRVHDALAIYVAAGEDFAEAVDVARTIQDVTGVSIERHLPAETHAVSQSPMAYDSVKRSRSALGRTVRVDVSLLDSLMDMVGELVIDRTRLTQIASRLLTNGDTLGLGSEISSLAAHLQRTSAELQEGIMQARLLPLRSIFSKFPRMMRDLAQKCGKEIHFEVAGETTELDRTVLEAIDDPLIHILRNAVDHGIEYPDERADKGKARSGKVILSAWHEENQVVIMVADDGAGLDPEKLRRAAVARGFLTEEIASNLSHQEVLNLMFAPGFSTAPVASDVSGRGVGLDVVRANLERVNGKIEVSGKPGLGTKVRLRLPLTLAIMRALLVRCGGLVYAVPTSSVEEVFSLRDFAVHTIKGKPAVNLRGRVIPLVSLEGALYGSMWDMSEHRYALLTTTANRSLAIGVDELVGEEEIVVKSMGALLSRLKGVSGATILAQGDPAVILDVQRII